MCYGSRAIIPTQRHIEDRLNGSHAFFPACEGKKPRVDLFAQREGVSYGRGENIGRHPSSARSHRQFVAILGITACGGDQRSSCVLPSCGSCLRRRSRWRKGLLCECHRHPRRRTGEWSEGRPIQVLCGLRDTSAGTAGATCGTRDVGSSRPDAVRCGFNRVGFNEETNGCFTPGAGGERPFRPDGTTSVYLRTPSRNVSIRFIVSAVR